MFKDKLIVTCNCGCGNGFEFKVLGELIFVSALSSDFYSLQDRFVDKLRDTVKEYALRKHRKVNIIKDVVVSREDIEALLSFLEERIDSLTIDENESRDNYSLLHIERIDFGEEDIKEEDVSYSIEYRSINKSFSEIFFTKRHRKFDLVLTKKEAKRLIANCKKVLK